jgi:hypothetical protein
MNSSKQTASHCCIETRIRDDKVEMADEANIQDWKEVLFGIGGRNFDNIWLNLFATVADKKYLLQNK